ncbi:MAG: hypothetical protein ACPGUV_03210 [Polyangiales bacterium]
MQQSRSDFARLGGEPVLRALIAAFVERVCDDLMIGFYFQRTDRAQLCAREYEHAAAFLGAGVVYHGRPLAAVHQPRRIMGGHFDRRLHLLAQVWEDFQVPEDIRQRWRAHQLAQRSLITADAPGQCA